MPRLHDGDEQDASTTGAVDWLAFAAIAQQRESKLAPDASDWHESEAVTQPVPESIEVQASYTARIRAEFEAHPLEWIGAHHLAQIGGFCAWRSRISDARQRIEKEGAGTIRWNGDRKASAYMFTPYKPLGRDAGTFTTQKSLF